MTDKRSVKKGLHITVEKDIAGRLSFLRNFGHRIPDLNEQIESVIKDFCAKQEKKLGIPETAWRTSRPCPACSTGVLLPRSKKNEAAPSFMGCSKFPNCRHTENLDAKDKK